MTCSFVHHIGRGLNCCPIFFNLNSLLTVLALEEKCKNIPLSLTDCFSLKYIRFVTPILIVTANPHVRRFFEYIFEIMLCIRILIQIKGVGVGLQDFSISQYHCTVLIMVFYTPLCILNLSILLSIIIKILHTKDKVINGN